MWKIGHNRAFSRLTSFPLRRVKMSKSGGPVVYAARPSSLFSAGKFIALEREELSRRLEVRILTGIWMVKNLNREMPEMEQGSSRFDLLTLQPTNELVFIGLGWTQIQAGDTILSETLCGTRLSSLGIMRDDSRRSASCV